MFRIQKDPNDILIMSTVEDVGNGHEVLALAHFPRRRELMGCRPPLWLVMADAAAISSAVTRAVGSPFANKPTVLTIGRAVAS